VLNFITDTLYAGGTQAIMSKEDNIKAFSYVWGRPNPVPSFASEFPGIATHCTEMIYTTGLYLDELNEEDRKLSCTMVERWILFACGFDPWKSRQPERYDLTTAESGLKVELYENSEYRRVEAQDYISQNIDICGSLLREFLEESDGEVITP
jgi:carboxylesterase type B